MTFGKIKKAISLGLSLLLIGKMPFSVSAADLVAIPENVQQAIPPTYPSIVQTRSISMKYIEAKMSNILNPAKKEGGNKVNRKQLATDDSGSCGDGVTYTFTASTGKLVISYAGSGSGAMNSSPWYSYNEYIKSVIIENGVTSIDSFAFDNSSLTSVSIPDSVISIGDCAFFDCKGLKGSLTIPDSVTSIGDCAFEGCSGLTSINVDAINKYYKSIDGILYSNDVKTLIKCPGGKTGYLSIPSSVTSLAYCAFSGCSSLTGSLTIPSSVTSISVRAFYGCSGLTGSLTIPSSVTSIGNDAFYGCSGLTGSLTIPEGVTSIGYQTFYNCKGLDGSLTIPNSVTSIGASAFNGCSGLTSVTIPSSVHSIGESAFRGCSGLTSVTYK